MTNRTPVLMTGSNPGGWKLEELAEVLAAELETKSTRLEGDESPVAQDVLRNNRDIVARLREIVVLQRASLRRLDTVAPDPGPTGKPRVGQGSR